MPEMETGSAEQLDFVDRQTWKDWLEMQLLIQMQIQRERARRMVDQRQEEKVQMSARDPQPYCLLHSCDHCSLERLQNHWQGDHQIQAG